MALPVAARASITRVKTFRPEPDMPEDHTGVTHRWVCYFPHKMTLDQYKKLISTNGDAKYHDQLVQMFIEKGYASDARFEFQGQKAVWEIDFNSMRDFLDFENALHQKGAHAKLVKPEWRFEITSRLTIHHKDGRKITYQI
jgi:hypothetical protein